jgi:uncharacterized protein
MSKFQVYRDAAGKFRFRLRAGNNQIVAIGEAYEQHAGCINGIRSIQRNCNAEIEDLTIIDRKVPNPKYQIYKDAKGEFRFRLKAPNGEIIAEGEGYESKDGCLNGIEVVRGSGNAEIEDSYASKKVSQNKTPSEVEEAASSTETSLKGMSSTEKVNEIKVETQKTEPPPLPIDAKAETQFATVMPEVPETREKLPQHDPAMPLESQYPKESLPMETKLELVAVPTNLHKGNYVTFQGKLYSNKSGRGISGAKIKIYERDTSILGDDYLAFGATGDDGAFTIVWKARSLTWRKNNGNIYAKFAGNEKAKPSKSDAKTINVT